MLDKKTAIITGASRGIGKAIAEELARNGANIAFTYNSNDQKAEELKASIEALGRKCYCKKFDISNFDESVQFVKEVIEHFEKIDVLVNNAGITRDKALALMTKEEWESVIDTNLTGTFNMSRAVIFYLMKQKEGNIINITSVSGISGLSHQTNYSASKAGMIGFTKALAKEVAAYNIRVNAVAPGFIETDMINSMSDKLKEQALKDIPLKRFGKVEEVASFVKFLLDGGSDYITGHVFPIDGGLAI